MSAQTRPRLSRIHYGWWVVLVAGAAVLLSAGVRSAPGVFLLPIESDVGLDRSTVSLAVSVGLLVYGLSAPLSGKLIDNIGSRAVAVIGLTVVGVSMALSAMASDALRIESIGCSGKMGGVSTPCPGVGTSSRR
jgi:MFS family permease